MLELEKVLLTKITAVLTMLRLTIKSRQKQLNLL